MTEDNRAPRTGSITICGLTFIELEEISRGGSALVYKAKSPEDNPVAIREYVPKAYYTGRTEDGTPLFSVPREKIEAAFRMEVDNALAASRCLSNAEGPYLVDGSNLCSVTRLHAQDSRLLSEIAFSEQRTDSPFPDLERLKYGVSVMKSALTDLRILHDSGWIHCDLSETNVRVSGTARVPTVHLFDFGSARKLDEDGYVRGNDLPASTQVFRAPELKQPNSYLSKATDLYSCCILWYSMIVEPTIFVIPELFDALFCAEQDREILIEDLSEVRVPESVREKVLQILLKGLAYHQSNRYQSADEFLSDLSELENKLLLYSDSALYNAMFRTNATKNRFFGLENVFYPELCPPVLVKGKEKNIEQDMLLPFLLSAEQGQHFYLTGSGGAGKSAILEQTAKRLQEKGEMVLFLSLSTETHSLEHRLNKLLGTSQRETLYSICSNAEDSARVFFLLDGLNELRRDIRSTVLREIQELCRYSNTVIVVSGREPKDAVPELNCLDSCIQVENLSLEQLYGLFGDDASEQVYNPLMARIFLAIREDGIEDASLGGMLEQFLHKIVEKQMAEQGVPVWAANALPLFAAWLAVEMVKNNTMFLRERDLEKAVHQFVESGLYAALTKANLRPRDRKIRLLDEDGEWTEELAELYRLLTSDYLVGDENEQIFLFPHQVFRDFFYAKAYCFDAARATAQEGGTLADSGLWSAEEIEDEWNVYCALLADLLSKKALTELLDAHRHRGKVFEAEKVNAQWRLFEVLKKKWHYDLSDIDFSGLDLRQMSLRNIVLRRGGNNFSGAMIGSALNDGEISSFVDAIMDRSGKKIALLGLMDSTVVVEYRDCRKGTLLSAVVLDKQRFSVNIFNRKQIQMRWSENGTLIVWDNNVAVVLSDGNVSYLGLDSAPSPSPLVVYDSHLLAVNNGNTHHPALPQVLVLEVADDTLVLPDQDWLTAAENMVFSGDGHYLFCFRQNRRLCRFDLKTGEQLEMERKQENDGEEPLIIASSFHGSAFLILHENVVKDTVIELVDWNRHRADEIVLEKKYAPMAAIVDDVEEESVHWALIAKNTDPERFGLCLLRTMGVGQRPVVSPVRWDGGTIDLIHGAFQKNEPHFLAVSSDRVSTFCGGGVSLSSWSYRPKLRSSWSLHRPFLWDENGSVSLQYGEFTRRLKVRETAVTMEAVLTVPAHLDRGNHVSWAYSPDGRYFAYRVLEKNATCQDAIYDSAREKTTQLGTNRSTAANPFLWSVDSGLVLVDRSSSMNREQYIFDLSSEKVVKFPQGPQVQEWVLSPDLHTAAALYWEYTQDSGKLKVELLDVETGIVRKIDVPETLENGNCSVLGLSSEVLSLVTNKPFDFDHAHQSWRINTRTGEVLRGPLLEPTPISSFSTGTSCGTTIQGINCRVRGSSNEFTVVRITTQDGCYSFQPPKQGCIEALSVSPDDQFLLLVFGDGELMFYHLPSVLKGENPPPIRRLHVIPNLNLQGACFDNAVFSSAKTLQIVTENGGKTDKALLATET